MGHISERAVVIAPSEVEAETVLVGKYKDNRDFEKVILQEHFRLPEVAAVVYIHDVD